MMIQTMTEEIDELKKVWFTMSSIEDIFQNWSYIPGIKQVKSWYSIIYYK